MYVCVWCVFVSVCLCVVCVCKRMFVSGVLFCVWCVCTCMFVSGVLFCVWCVCTCMFVSGVCCVCLYVFVLGSGWLPPRGDPGNTVIICCG